MTQEKIEMYAPKNAANLTQEQTIAMQSFGIEELAALAKAHPNTGTRGAYLVLYDKSKDRKKQLFSLSTWKNLHDLHRMGQTQYVAYSFRTIFNRKNENSLPTAPVQDLTKEQARNELKKGTKANVKTAAAQVAEEEGAGITGGKSLEDMDRKELMKEYESVVGKAPARNLSTKQLIEKIQAALDPKE